MKDTACIAARIALVLYGLTLLFWEWLSDPGSVLVIGLLLLIAVMLFKDECQDMVAEPSPKALNWFWLAITLLVFAGVYGPSFGAQPGRIDLISAVYHFPFFLFWLVVHSPWNRVALPVPIGLAAALFLKKYRCAGWMLPAALIALATYLRMDAGEMKAFRLYFESI